MGQRGAVELRQKRTKPPLNKPAVANCTLSPHAPAQVETNAQGNETGATPFVKL